MMALLFISKSDDPRAWIQALKALLPDLEVRIWPEVGDPNDIEVALVWKPPPGVLSRFPNLKLIASLGMGVDHILSDPELPPGVPIARLVDEDIIAQMGEYVGLAALYFHRRLDDYERLQGQRRWQPLPPPDTAGCTVGIMGLGAIGSHAANRLKSLGFAVAGWSRTPKSLPGVECLHGTEGLGPFLTRSRILVCLLPLTPQTEGIISARTLALLPSGAYIVNCARGDHVVDEDLIAALDSGHIAGAMLDVFRCEPLPADHPFWGHPRVHITPHIAGLTRPEVAVLQVVENIRRVRAGEPIRNRVDPGHGY